MSALNVCLVFGLFLIAANTARAQEPCGQTMQTCMTNNPVDMQSFSDQSKVAEACDNMKKLSECFRVAFDEGKCLTENDQQMKSSMDAIINQYNTVCGLPNQGMQQSSKCANASIAAAAECQILGGPQSDPSAMSDDQRKELCGKIDEGLKCLTGKLQESGCNEDPQAMQVTQVLIKFKKDCSGGASEANSNTNNNNNNDSKANSENSADFPAVASLSLLIFSLLSHVI